jgi:HEAT repeat protein
MAKAKSVDARLARVRVLRGEVTSPQTLHELRKAIADSSNLVVAEAAAIAGERRALELTPDLVAAFDRLLEDPVKTDKLCRAKIAIAETLNQFEFAEEEFLWRGARHVQPEPVWGGSVDTAAPLRVACAFSLVRLRASGVMPFLVDLLSDPEKAARAGAAQALAYSETEAAALLLRLKARTGDADAEVISECFDGLLKLTPESGVAFVAEFLDSSDVGVQEAAILALGDSRRQEAFAILTAFWQRQTDSRIQETVLMALSLLRLPAATDFLLTLVASEGRALATAALAALALHRYDARLRERTEEAVVKSGSALIRASFEKRFREGE